MYKVKKYKTILAIHSSLTPYEVYSLHAWLHGACVHGRTMQPPLYTPVYMPHYALRTMHILQLLYERAPGYGTIALATSQKITTHEPITALTRSQWHLRLVLQVLRHSECDDMGALANMAACRDAGRPLPVATPDIPLASLPWLVELLPIGHVLRHISGVPF